MLPLSISHQQNEDHSNSNSWSGQSLNKRNTYWSLVRVRLTFNASPNDIAPAVPRPFQFKLSSRLINKFKKSTTLTSVELKYDSLSMLPQSTRRLQIRYYWKISWSTINQIKSLESITLTPGQSTCSSLSMLLRDILSLRRQCHFPGSWQQ